MERAPKNLVVDASVVAKWFVPERDSDRAVQLRNRHIEGTLTLIAPDLLIYEIANALAYHSDISVDDLKEDIEALFLIDVELVPPSSELLASVAEAARKNNISVYDSSYLTLAEVTATNMVTADKKLLDKIKDKDRVFMLDEMNVKWKL